MSGNLLFLQTNWIDVIKENEDKFKVLIKEFFKVKDFYIEFIFSKSTSTSANLKNNVHNFTSKYTAINNYIKMFLDGDLKDITESIKENIHDLRFLKNYQLIFFIILFFYFLFSNDEKTSKLIVTNIGLNFATGFIKKYFRTGIIDNYFQESLENLSKRSLFSPYNKSVKEVVSKVYEEYLPDDYAKQNKARYNSHPVLKALIFVIDFEYKKFKNEFIDALKNKKTKFLLELMVKFLSDIRNKLNQSFRFLARNYYSSVRNINVAHNDLEQDMNETPYFLQALKDKVVNRIKQYLTKDEFIFNKVYSMTKVNKKDLDKMFKLLYKPVNYELVEDVVDYLIHYSDYEILLKPFLNKKQKDELLEKWLRSCKKTIARRTKIPIREILVTIILSSDELKERYRKINITYKRKYIEAIGLLIASYIFKYK